MRETKVIIIKDLPKISTNKFYSGMHWTKRKKIKDVYKYLIRSKHKGQFLKSKQYEVEYTFYFKTRALDASNCSAMVKMIEEILFEDDKSDIITSVTMKSRKGKEEYVEIKIDEL